MGARTRMRYIDLKQSDVDLIVNEIKSGKTKNAVLMENNYSKAAIDLVIENAGIKYEDKRPPNLRRSKPKSEPIRTEDIPRLCAEEMPPVHKMLNRVWKPTGLNA